MSGFTTKYSGSSYYLPSYSYKRSYSSSLGFDSSSFYGSTIGSYNYSKYKWSSKCSSEDNQKIEILKNAYKPIHDLVVILDYPYKVDVCFTTELYNRTKQTDTKYVFIPSSCLSKEGSSLSEKEAIEILSGEGIHEAAHLKYTSLRVLAEFYKILDAIYDRDGESTIEVGELNSKSPLTSLVNIVEDERIEDKLLKERPGYSIFLDKKRERDFNRLNAVFKGEAVWQIVKLIRYKEFLGEETDETMLEVLKQVSEQMKTVYEDGANTKTSCKAAYEILNILKSNFTDDRINFVLNNKKTSLCNSVKVGNDGDLRARLDPSVKRECASFSTSGSQSKLIEEEKVLVGQWEKFDGEVFFIKDTIVDEGLVIDEVKKEYSNIAKRVSKLVAPLRKKLVMQNKNYENTLKGCRSGLLDTTKLAEAYQGVPQVYTRQQKVSTSDLTICVLVDESGSMGGWCCGSKSKAYMARDAAVLFREAFGTVPGVDLYIYGHSADENYSGDDNTVIRVYSEPNDSFGKYVGLANIAARVENRDGNAILNTIKRVRKRTSDHIVLFVISDGSPCAGGYYGSSAIKDTRDKVNEVRKKYDTDVIGICIDACLSDAQRIYGKESVIDLRGNMDKFPDLLGKLISSTIQKNRKVSYTS